MSTLAVTALFVPMQESLELAIVVLAYMLPVGISTALGGFVPGVAASLAGGPATALVDGAYLQGSKLIIVNQTPTLLDDVAEVIVHADVATVLPAINEALQELKGDHVV